MAQASAGAPRRLRKILSLDGGGVRGLSTVVLLGEVMTQLNFDREQKVDPWQEFDMIGGTSTGGLIAIMLGRLHMTVKECEQAYCKFSEEIFQPRRDPLDPRRLLDFVNARGKFDANTLKRLVKDSVQEAQYHEEELLKDTRPDACKVLVSVIRGDDTSATVLRSYVSRQPGAARLIDECTIWQAARATSAASTFFDPVEIGPHGQIFVDGGLRNNNPINQVYEEARSLWPNDDLAVLTIGTGDAPGHSLQGNLKTVVERLKEISLDAKETSDTFIKNHPEMYRGNRLFRMNVPGLASIGLEEYKERSVIVSRTESYIEEPATRQVFDPCIEVFGTPAPRVTVATEDPKPHFYLRHPIFEDLAISSPGKDRNGVGACGKCFRIFTDGGTTHWCTSCELELCDICQLSHQYHQRATVTKTYRAIAWNSSLGTSEVAKCSVCARPVLIGLTCETCKTSVCNNCKRVLDTRKLWVAEHLEANPTHKFYISDEIALDGHYTMTGDAQCPCRLQGTVVDHCAACAKPIVIGDNSYICTTCLITFGGSHRLCSGCVEKMDPQHRKQHALETILHDRSPDAHLESEENKNRESYLCLECNTSFESGIRPSIVHPSSGPRHYRFKQWYGNTSLENWRISSLRLCPKRGLRIDQPRQVPKALLHGCPCGECIPAGTIGSQCFTYGCGYSYCALCHQQKVTFHRHPLVTVEFLHIGGDDNSKPLKCWMCNGEFRGETLNNCVKCPKCSAFVCSKCLWNKINNTSASSSPPKLCQCRHPPDNPRWWFAQKTTNKESLLPTALMAKPATSQS